MTAYPIILVTIFKQSICFFFSSILIIIIIYEIWTAIRSTDDNDVLKWVINGKSLLKLLLGHTNNWIPVSVIEIDHCTNLVVTGRRHRMHNRRHYLLVLLLIHHIDHHDLRTLIWLDGGGSAIDIILVIEVVVVVAVDDEILLA